MKFKVGDQVLVTGGKDKGKKGPIIKVIPATEKVVVEGANHYTKHVKPTQGKAGERVSYPRALPTSNVAILNDKGQVDRIGYNVGKDGEKVRIFKKTGGLVPTVKASKK